MEAERSEIVVSAIDWPSRGGEFGGDPFVVMTVTIMGPSLPSGVSGGVLKLSFGSFAKRVKRLEEF